MKTLDPWGGASLDRRGLIDRIYVGDHILIYLFIQYFKRVALLAKLASLNKQNNTTYKYNIQYMGTSEFKRIKDAINTKYISCGPHGLREDF